MPPKLLISTPSTEQQVDESVGLMPPEQFSSTVWLVLVFCNDTHVVVIGVLESQLLFESWEIRFLHNRLLCGPPQNIHFQPVGQLETT